MQLPNFILQNGIQVSFSISFCRISLRLLFFSFRLFLFLRDQEVFFFHLFNLSLKGIVRLFDEVLAACEDLHGGSKLVNLIVLVADGLLKLRILQLDVVDLSLE